MAAAIIGGGGGWRRLRGIGKGASGALISLAVDDASGELFVVKSAAGEDAAARQQLRREWSVMAGLSSQHVLKCLGFTSGGEHRLFLEFAPGGSLSDVVARNGGCLDEGAVRAYLADVLRGLDYLHGKLVVHGDVKGSNVVVGANGRAKLADFGCASVVIPGGSKQPVIGGTPAFMAPEVARGEEQGPAADVWALGCTVVEMFTGRAPWSDMDNVLAALRKIGYTDAVPEVPQWLSPVAKDFLHRCLQRRAGDRPTAAQLLQHPFVSSSCGPPNKEVVKGTWVSPTSALDAALWESVSSSSTDDDEEDDTSSSPTSRIGALACSGQTLPDWDTEHNGWIEVRSTAAADIESPECPAKRVIGSLACSPSAVPNWDSDDDGWIEVLSNISINVANKTTAAATDNESSECPAKRVSSMACSPSSVPDWDSDQGWIDVLSAKAVGSIINIVGVGSEQSVVAENQDDKFTSLSSCSQRVLLVAVRATDSAASRVAGIKKCSRFSY
ncbi:mitogen-activated protein kinase kinase kinase 18-like [Oryza brachyantha]|uniref:mitogen-activated protein kinase kinase kinase 18-like n=1 Tax=Oryza brachyantha TaxID=4533 RepID=UPI001ADC4D7C|nr:mitogen-activated protein kinase kinase kinase 18-like [Oryza brachyantha]